MAVPGEQESFKSQSFSSPKRTTSIPSGAADANRRLAAERQQTREKFFDNRQDVSANRLDRRLKQAQEEKDFISTLKPVEGTGGTLLQEQAPVFNPMTGRYERTTLADKRMQLANKYGPTFAELASDMGYAFGSMARGAGDILQSGSFGILGAIKGIANYALDKANKGYDKLNDVQKYIFDNADKLPFASKIAPVEEVSKAEELALEADRDALGLELDALMAEREFRYNNPTVDMRKPTIEEMRTMPITQSGVFPAEEVKEAAMDRFSSEYLEEQKRLLDELNVMPTVEELQPQDSLSTDDGTKVTAYNNPVNLQFAGQQGAVEGQTYGNNFAVFPDAETGIMAAKKDLALKTERYGGDVDKIIGEFSPRSDNPESFDNYVNFVKSGVGETVDPGEEDELLRRVIRFENKPDIANQYLTMVADGGMIDKQLKSLQNGLQNMYNGIPSVRRR